MHVYAIVLFIFACIMTWLQESRGSRFFLPNRCRTKVYEYRRRISDDFDLAKINESMWPECDLCLEKLNHPSHLQGRKSLSVIEGNDYYGIYMKTTTNSKYHYFCLLWMINQNTNRNYPLIGLDTYDD